MMVYMCQSITVRVGVWMVLSLGNYTDPRLGVGFNLVVMKSPSR